MIIEGLSCVHCGRYITKKEIEQIFKSKEKEIPVPKTNIKGEPFNEGAQKP